MNAFCSMIVVFFYVWMLQRCTCSRPSRTEVGSCGNADIAIHGGEKEEKVVVLRELHKAIIYTTELSKQVTEDHVSTAFIAY
jgi:hypothetical protein